MSTSITRTALFLAIAALAPNAIAQPKPPAPPGGAAQPKPAPDAKSDKPAAPEDQTYKSKTAKFQVTGPADKTWDYYADEDSRKQFLVPAYKSRCVTFFHDIAGKKELAEVSVTAIDKKEAEPE